MAAGASLYIDNIQVFNAVDDTVVSQVAKLITYQTTATTLTEADRTARTLTFTATDADGNSNSNTAIIFEDFPVEEVVAPPPQQVAIVNAVTEVNVPASEIKISRDGLQTFVRDKEIYFKYISLINHTCKYHLIIFKYFYHLFCCSTMSR